MKSMEKSEKDIRVSKGIIKHSSFQQEDGTMRES